MSAAPQYQQHPVAQVIPPPSDDEFGALCASIAEDGLRESIALYGGRVLDGWSRLRACLETATVPKFEEFVGSEEQAFRFVVAKNCLRRHLTTQQRTELALMLLPQFEAFAAARKRVGQDRGRETRSGRRSADRQPEERRTAAADAARAAGVSERSVRRAKAKARKKAAEAREPQAKTKEDRPPRLRKTLDALETAIKRLPDRLAAIIAHPEFQQEDLRTIEHELLRVLELVRRPKPKRTGRANTRIAGEVAHEQKAESRAARQAKIARGRLRVVPTAEIPRAMLDASAWPDEDGVPPPVAP